MRRSSHLFILFAITCWLERHTYVDWASHPTAKLILSSRDRNCKQYVTGARMWPAFFIAALWATNTVMQTNVPLHVRIGAGGSFATGYLLAWFIPVWFRQRHVRNRTTCWNAAVLCSWSELEPSRQVIMYRQKGRCKPSADWRHTGVWVTPLLQGGHCSMGSPPGLHHRCRFAFRGNMSHPLWMDWKADRAGKTSAGAMGCDRNKLDGAAVRFDRLFRDVGKPVGAENCGERLSVILSGKRSLEAFRDGSKSNFDLDGLTPGEVFGLGVTFTRKELDLARRKLVKELRRWHYGRLKMRTAREMALRRVNVAYDALRGEAA